MGNLLACRRFFQLDHCALVAGSSAHARPLCRAQGITSQQSVLGLCFRAAVGTWRAHLRLNNALPRYVSRNGRCPRVYSRFRNSDAADFPRTIQKRSPGHTLRNDYPHRCCHMPVWNRVCRHRRNVQRKRTVTRTKAAVHQGIRSEERTAGSHFLWRNERMLRLWIGSGRSHQRNDHSSRHAVSVAGPASTGRSLVGWIYHEFHLVRCAQYPQSHGLPVPRFRNPSKPTLGSAT